MLCSLGLEFLTSCVQTSQISEVLFCILVIHRWPTSHWTPILPPIQCFGREQGLNFPFSETCFLNSQLMWIRLCNALICQMSRPGNSIPLRNVCHHTLPQCYSTCIQAPTTSCNQYAKEKETRQAGLWDLGNELMKTNIKQVKREQGTEKL